MQTEVGLPQRPGPVGQPALPLGILPIPGGLPPRMESSNRPGRALFMQTSDRQVPDPELPTSCSPRLPS